LVFYVPDSKRRQGQQYLWFAAVGKAQTLTAKTSASSTDIKPQSLHNTGLFSLVLEAENVHRFLSAFMKRGIWYTERGAVEYACNYVYRFVD